MRVRSVRRVILPSPVPVYDLEVAGTHNFKLDAGPFVHNSKDLADAIACVVYRLSTQREVWSYHRVPVMNMPPSLAKDTSKK